MRTAPTTVAPGSLADSLDHAVAAGLQCLVWRDSRALEPEAARWQCPRGVWTFWYAPTPAYGGAWRWSGVGPGLEYINHDTLPAAFANAQRIEAELAR